MYLRATPNFWISFAMVVGLMGTALISPLYPIYKAAWNLSTSEITLIYVIYMAATLAGLLFLSRITDKIGFKRVLLAGLVMALLGTMITMLAQSLMVLYIGRFVVGMSSGCLTTAGSAGLVEMSPPGEKERAAKTTGILIAFSIGLGPLTGGIFGQWMPDPMLTTYIPNLVLCVLAIWGVVSMKTHDQNLQPLPNLRDFIPNVAWVRPDKTWAFALICGFPFLAFSVFGMQAGLSPLFLEKMVPFPGPIVSGVNIALILLTSAMVQKVVGHIPTWKRGLWAMLFLALSSALLIVNLSLSSTIVFGFCILTTALGHGMCLSASMSSFSALADDHKRSSLFATYLVIGYIGGIVPLWATGWVADIWGMASAVSGYSGAVIVLSLVWGSLFARNALIRGC